MPPILTADQLHDVRLDICVWPDVWVGLYNRIEVWRSVLGESGPYEELTAENWSSARVPDDAGAPSNVSGPHVNIVGKSLELLVGLSAVTVTFTGSDPLTFSQVATQISSAGGPLFYAYVDATGTIVIESCAIGGQARLEVTGGDAAALLGLPLSPPDSVGYGHEPRIPLVAGRSTYVFRDFYGKDSYFYKVRFSNLSSGAVSDFSGPITPVPDAGLSSDKLVTGYVKLLRGDGRPDVKQEVIVFTPSTGQQIEGATITGGQRVLLTDASGRVEVRLIRGMRIDVSVGAMNLMRSLTVPCDPAVESFDMLSPDYGTDDTFAVQRLNLPYAEKENL